MKNEIDRLLESLDELPAYMMRDIFIKLMQLS